MTEALPAPVLLEPSNPGPLNGELRARFELASPYGPNLNENGLDTTFARNALHLTRDGWEAMRASKPDFYVGMVVLGSMVKGQAHEQSDIDGIIFYQPSPQFDHDRAQIDNDIQNHLLRPFQKNGYGPSFQNRRAFRSIPTNKEIIDEEVTLLETMLRVDQSSPTDILDDQLLGLFYLRLGSGNLQKLRQAVVRRLECSPYGAVIGAALMERLAKLEEGNRGASVYLPKTLNDITHYFGL